SYQLCRTTYQPLVPFRSVWNACWMHRLPTLVDSIASSPFPDLPSFLFAFYCPTFSPLSSSPPSLPSLASKHHNRLLLAWALQHPISRASRARCMGGLVFLSSLLSLLPLFVYWFIHFLFSSLLPIPSRFATLLCRSFSFLSSSRYSAALGIPSIYLTFLPRA